MTEQRPLDQCAHELKAMMHDTGIAPPKEAPPILFQGLFCFSSVPEGVAPAEAELRNSCRHGLSRDTKGHHTLTFHKQCCSSRMITCAVGGGIVVRRSRVRRCEPLEDAAKPLRATPRSRRLVANIPAAACEEDAAEELGRGRPSALPPFDCPISKEGARLYRVAIRLLSSSKGMLPRESTHDDAVRTVMASTRRVCSP